MTVIYYTIGISYIAYYTANIVYDLLFKQDKIKKEEETIEISLEDLAEEKVEQIAIDDVESLNTPNSYQDISKQIQAVGEPEPIDIEELRRRFEAEESLDFLEELTASMVVPKLKTEKVHNNFISEVDVMNFLREAETQVQLVKNIDGFKTYAIKDL